MTHDDHRGNARDVRFAPVGVGMASTFRCARCAGFRSITGRKLEKVQGVRQYVCASCAEPKK